MIILLHCLLFSVFCTVSTCIIMFGYTWCEPVNSWTGEARPLHILHRKPFTAETLHTSSLLHFWTRPSCKENFLRQKAFAPEVFTTNTSCTKFLLHLALRDLLYIHQKPSTPAAHLKHFTPNNFLHRIFLHQEPFTADPFYTKQACKNNPAQPKFSTPFQLISFTPQDFCIHLHQAILTPKNP